MSCECYPALEPRQSGEVIGQIGEGDFGGCARLADGPDEQVKSSLLGREDMLDLGSHPRPGGVASADVGGHRLAARLPALELGNQSAPVEQLQIGLRTIGGVR